MKKHNIFTTAFSVVYPLYLTKVEKKGRTKEEVDSIVFWLTGYDAKGLKKVLDEKIDFQTFFENAPKFNPNASRIKGVICGHRVEDIEDKLMQKIRYLDKMVDELAKGKPLQKIFRD
ncbi:MAG: DUF2200 domain-containing protein [Leptospiraceae bacterium]|nr:DUF2200 domain-containing protein [Leptospiraceae bacterium]MCP5510244.1 DUF2200 domain-containing protein [Leptospiraceae bacterium]